MISLFQVLKCKRWEGSQKKQKLGIVRPVLVPSQLGISIIVEKIEK